MSDDQREAEHVILRGERDGICFEILLGGIIRIIKDGTVIQKGPREWFQSAYRHEGMPSSAAPEALRKPVAYMNSAGNVMSVSDYNRHVENPSWKWVIETHWTPATPLYASLRMNKIITPQEFTATVIEAMNKAEDEAGIPRGSIVNAFVKQFNEQFDDDSVPSPLRQKP